MSMHYQDFPPNVLSTWEIAVGHHFMGIDTTWLGCSHPSCLLLVGRPDNSHLHGRFTVWS